MQTQPSTKISPTLTESVKMLPLKITRCTVCHDSQIKLYKIIPQHQLSMLLSTLFFTYIENQLCHYNIHKCRIGEDFPYCLECHSDGVQWYQWWQFHESSWARLQSAIEHTTRMVQQYQTEVHYHSESTSLLVHCHCHHQYWLVVVDHSIQEWVVFHSRRHYQSHSTVHPHPHQWQTGLYWWHRG